MMIYLLVDVVYFDALVQQQLDAASVAVHKSVGGSVISVNASSCQSHHADESFCFRHLFDNKKKTAQISCVCVCVCV